MTHDTLALRSVTMFSVQSMYITHGVLALAFGDDITCC